MGDKSTSLALLSVILVLASQGAVAENNHGGSATSFWNEEFTRAAEPQPARRAAPRHVVPTDHALISHRDEPRRPRVVASVPPAPAVRTPAPATVVAVFGDRLGHVIASGLQEGGAGPLGVIDASSEDAGLASKDFDGWLQVIRDRLSNPDRLSIAVMLIGANDRVPLQAGAETAEPGTPRWQALYGARIDAVAGIFREAHIPLIWVGLPAVRDDTMSADFVRLNGMFRDRAERDGASYVDCWEAFLNDQGRYSPIGPDVEGDSVKLRKADGFSFTHAGARKLASFVAPDVKRLRPPPVVTGHAVADISIDKPAEFDSALAIDVNAQIRREAGLPPQPDLAPTGMSAGALVPAPHDPLPVKAAAGPILPLTAPPLAPGGLLATAAPPPAGPLQGLQTMLIAKSPAVADSQPPKPGRADDFRWPKP